jgi:tetratricopeptide (TPR) repeat protein
MIAKNEAAIVGRCLASVAGCADEIIVVDTGSADATRDIAAVAGATVIPSDWRDDFSYSRNISIRAAAGAWILWLDADDVVPASSIAKINELKQFEPDKVYGFIVRNEKPGGTGSEFMQARMFPNRKELYFERRIHEQMMPSALRQGMHMAQTDIVVEHHGYADPNTVKSKAGRNVRLLLGEWNKDQPDVVRALEIGDSYSLLGEPDQAQSWYQTVLSLCDKQNTLPEIAGQAALGLGNICNNKKKHEEAIRWFTRCLALSPGRADALFSLAVAQDLSGNLIAAAETLRSIVSAEPGRTLIVGVDVRESRIRAYLRLERVLFDMGKADEALTVAREAVEILPERPEILDMAGRVFLKNKLLAEALHAFEKSLQFNIESNLEAYIGLCRIYSLAGRMETAVQTITNIRPLFGNRPQYWAFRLLLTGAAGEADLPAEIDKKDITAETATLRKLYGIH